MVAVNRARRPPPGLPDCRIVLRTAWSSLTVFVGITRALEENMTLKSLSAVAVRVLGWLVILEGIKSVLSSVFLWLMREMVMEVAVSNYAFLCEWAPPVSYHPHLGRTDRTRRRISHHPEQHVPRADSQQGNRRTALINLIGLQQERAQPPSPPRPPSRRRECPARGAAGCRRTIMGSPRLNCLFDVLRFATWRNCD